MRHYSDYFHVKEDYCPNMTREEIRHLSVGWIFAPIPSLRKSVIRFCPSSVQEQSLSGLLETLAQENPMPPS